MTFRVASGEPVIRIYINLIIYIVGGKNSTRKPQPRFHGRIKEAPDGKESRRLYQTAD